MNLSYAEIVRKHEDQLEKPADHIISLYESRQRHGKKTHYKRKEREIKRKIRSIN